MIIQILIPVMAMAALGLIFGLGLALTLRAFGIETDATVALIITKLPGANCGACGKAGCAGFAEALERGETIPAGCVVSNEEARRSISELLGVEYNPKVKTVATVRCGGGKDAKDKYHYAGIKNCKAASLLFGGQKECAYGCLGFGDCARVCPFDAIKMIDDLPEVDINKCTACGKCVAACPKGLFFLAPTEKNYYVKCNSKDPGRIVAKVCKKGCIACGKCAKACPVAAITITDNLAAIDCERCENHGMCFEVCPTNCIARRSQDV